MPQSNVFFQMLMSVPLGEQSVMRMQIVMTQPAAMSVPASLATLVMDIHVRTLMSVLPILVMRMQLVSTIMGASPVSATLDMWEMDHYVYVSVVHSRLHMACVDYENIPTDQTCFVPVDCIHECGSNVSSEEACEAVGCCYNSSADVNCYYPSGEPFQHIFESCL